MAEKRWKSVWLQSLRSPPPVFDPVSWSAGCPRTALKAKAMVRALAWRRGQSGFHKLQTYPQRCTRMQKHTITLTCKGSHGTCVRPEAVSTGRSVLYILWTKWLQSFNLTSNWHKKWTASLRAFGLKKNHPYFLYDLYCPPFLFKYVYINQFGQLISTDWTFYKLGGSWLWSWPMAAQRPPVNFSNRITNFEGK